MTETPATTTLTTTDDGAPGTVLESTDLTLPVPSEVWSHPVDAWTQAQQALNPLRSSEVDRVIAPAAMVIFGVSGDLTSRKLMPALYDLAVGQPLPEGFSVVGVSHRDWSDEEFREKMREAVTASARTPVTEDAWQGFAKGLSYVRGDFRRSGHVRPFGRAAGRDRRRARYEGQPHLLPCNLAKFLPAHHPRAGVGRGLRAPGELPRAKPGLAAHRHRKTVRSRPPVGSRPDPGDGGRRSPNGRSIASITT